jgi:hypothetical protein
MLSGLRHLDLSGNLLAELPLEIGGCRQSISSVASLSFDMRQYNRDDETMARESRGAAVFLAGGWHA